MNIGKLGVWAMTETLTAVEAAAFARRVEQWGYGALWIPEAVGRNALVHASWLLANTQSLVIATGIANIYARDAQAMAAAQRTLAEQSGNRFLLGIGVSHAPLVEKLRGHVYAKPVETMRNYLDAMGRATYISPPPSERPPTVLAALGPKMLELSRDRADGAHPYLTTPKHTAEARALLGPGKWLCPEQKVMLETDPVKARRVGRGFVSRYLTLPNYRNNLLRLGYTEADVSNGGSDRLVDAIIAWGDEAAIRARIQEHWDAGADHVCIQAMASVEGELPTTDERLLEMLAPGQR
jgi:probable F420-dependent oxidoreductase